MVSRASCSTWSSASFIFGVGINQAITVMTFVYSLIGAIILLAIVNLVRRGSVR